MNNEQHNIMRERLIRMFRQSFVYTIGSLASPLMGIFMVPIYTRVFAPEDYGIIDLIQITVVFVSVALIMGMDNATGRYYLDKNNVKDKKVIAATALIFRAAILLTASIILALFSESISKLLFRSGQQSQFLVLAFIAIPFDHCFTLCLNMLRYEFRSISYTLLSVGKLVGKISLIILFVVFLKWGIGGVFSAALISSIVFMITVLIVTHKYFSLTFSLARLRQLLHYGLPLVPHGFTVYLIQNCSRYFLAHYGTLEEVGLYAVSAKLATLISFVFLGVGAALDPYIYSSYHEEETRRMYLKTTNYLIAGSVVAVLGLSLFAREILLIFTTSKYMGARAITPFLAAYVAFFYLGFQMSQGIHIARKTIYFTIISVITAVITIVLNLILVPLYGMMGAAVATLGGSMVWCVLLVQRSQVYYHVEYRYGAFIILFLATAIIIVISNKFFVEVSFLHIIVKIGLIILAAGLTYLTRLIGKAELLYIKSLLLKYIFRSK
jgi:O-antigen/teichoic acid export membrane protein